MDKLLLRGIIIGIGLLMLVSCDNHHISSNENVELSVKDLDTLYYNDSTFMVFSFEKNKIQSIVLCSELNDQKDQSVEIQELNFYDNGIVENFKSNTRSSDSLCGDSYCYEVQDLKFFETGELWYYMIMENFRIVCQKDGLKFYMGSPVKPQRDAEDRSVK